MRRSLLALCSAILIVAGCSSQQNRPTVGPEIAMDDGIPLTVENETTRSIRVYVVEAGQETLLGRVDAMTERSVRLRHSSAGMINLLARTGSTDDYRGHRSEPVQLLDGHRITWELRASPGSTGPRFSTVKVFRCETQGC